MENPEITSVNRAEPGVVTAAARLADAALAPGTRVGNFIIDRVLGVGGFGIVYRAEQDVTGRHVAIKEFFPSTMVDRLGSRAVSLHAESDAELFALGMRCFVKEATLLSGLHHPGLVQVLHFWEENGTAYMVMPLYEGEPLSSHARTLPPEQLPALIDTLMAGLMPALAYLHERQIYHRDISPDNVFMLANGQPLLLDFGAARRIVDKSESVTVILKTGYAPIEQYDEAGRQGAWTDIYAFSALLYKLVTGQAPPASAVRVCHDTVEPLARTQAGRFSPAVLRAIDAGLAVRPEDRPVSIAAWQRLLEQEGDTPPPEAPEKVVMFRSPGGGSGKRRTGLLALLLLTVVAAAGVRFWPQNPSRQVSLEARHLYLELDKVMPTLERSHHEAAARVEYYRQKLAQGRDPSAIAGLRVSLLESEEAEAVAAESLKVYAGKFRKELSIARKRLMMADSARQRGEAEASDLLFQSTWQQLSGLKDWSDAQVLAFANRRQASIQALNGVWAETACKRDAANWIVSNLVLHVSGAGDKPSEQVVAVREGKVYTRELLPKDSPQAPAILEYAWVRDNLVRRREGRKQTLKPCEIE